MELFKKYFKKRIAIFISIFSSVCIVVLLFSSNSFSQSGINSFYKDINPEFREPIRDSIVVIEDSIYFDGYLIFEIDRDLECFNENTDFQCEIYLIDKLNDINNSSDKYFYNFAMVYYLGYADRDNPFLIDSNQFEQGYNNNIRATQFSKFKNFIFSYFDKTENNPQFFFLRTLISTAIFDSTKTLFIRNVSKKNIGYFIYKCSFSTAILKYNCNYFERSCKNGKQIETKKLMENVKFMIPISSLYSIRSVNISELPSNLKLSSWFPNYIFKQDK